MSVERNEPASEGDLIERVAAAIYAVEYGRFSVSASSDHNRWTWQGWALSESTRNLWRAYARAAVDALREERDALRAENELLRAQVAAVEKIRDESGPMRMADGETSFRTPSWHDLTAALAATAEDQR